MAKRDKKRKRDPWNEGLERFRVKPGRPRRGGRRK